MKTFEDLNKERTEAVKKLNNIDKQIQDKQRRTIVQCKTNCDGVGCGMAATIADLEYIQTFYYESPYGCTGGDTWHNSIGVYICPHCGHRNHINKEIEQLKYLFGGMKDEK